MSQDPLNLSGSFQSHLNKAETVLIHLEEDWPELSQFSKNKAFPEEYRNAFTRAQELLAEHRNMRTLDTEDKRRRREIIAEGHRFYKELRTFFLFHFPKESERTKRLKQEFPYPAKNITAALGLLSFSIAFQNEETLPPYVTEEYLEKAEEVSDRMRHVIPELDFRRSDQKYIRRERDDAFRELLACKKLAKEIGQFAFRNNPEMKRRYR